MKLNNFCISEKASLINCKSIQKNHIGEAIVVDSSNKMLGIIAEADIQLIQGFNIKDDAVNTADAFN